MTHDEQDDLIFLVDKTLKEIEAVMEYVERNPDSHHCKGINLDDCKFKLKFQRASIGDITETLFGFNGPF